MKSFDLIVIGGGIAGLGIAEQAGARGLSALVLEARSCCSQTSDNTLRIIHGGFRYLQNFDFPRLVRSLRDQTELLRDVPAALTPLPCLMPLTKFGLKSRLPVACAALLYRTFMQASRSPLIPPRTLSSHEAESLAPFLVGKVPYGALCWYDAVMSEPSLVRNYLVERCTQSGVTILTNRPVVSLARSGRDFEIRDQEGTVWSAPRVVNSMGPWLDTLNLPSEFAGLRPGWCKGFNLIVSRQFDAQCGISLEGSDGRLFFCVPRGSGTAIGTWYEPHPPNSLPPQVSHEEIQRFLRAINDAIGTEEITPSDIVGFDVGVLPTMHRGTGSPVPLAHERISAHAGYIEVVSTKYTTFRSQARAVMQHL